mmetsp:Transcript_85703/g.142019  ORF Transcript_85703/g.142019 Transcript_85703/m.142019 type:complete len:133 (-) Transcript_85703:125-523(-)
MARTLAAMLYTGVLAWCFLIQPTRAAKYLIGQEANSGAFEVNFDDDKKTLDLHQDCHELKACPPVIIMTGRLVGTIEIQNCQDGVMYTFVNKSDLDAGIYVQNVGGQHGVKGINQFGVGTCFCYLGGELMCG